MEEEWKNPSDIMKSRRISRSSSRLSRSQSSNHLRRASHPSPKENMPSEDIVDSLKRRNPFICQRPEAKQKVLKRGHSIDTSDVSRLVSKDFFKEDPQPSNKQVHEDDDIAGRMGKNLKSIQNKLEEQKLRESNRAMNVPSAEQSNKLTILNDLDETDELKQCHSKPLLDWSVKTKMRVVITRSNSEGGGSKTIPGIDARHLKAFVTGRFDSGCNEWHSLDVIHKIRRCSYHYTYPNMPWMSTFPRTKSYFKARSSFLDTSNASVLSSLQKDWSRVFTSVYQQLRSGTCPYFYVCTHQFTVLFRCLRSSSKCFLTALLSPSTRGFRELLKKEGIAFQMPNLKAEMDTSSKKKEKTKPNDRNHRTGSEQESEGKSCVPKEESIEETGYQSNDEDLFDSVSVKDTEDVTNKLPSNTDGKNVTADHDNDKDSNECEISAGDESDEEDHLAADWLEDMGLDKKDFPSLRPHNVKLQQENFRDIDNRTQSMVYMQGLDVHAFFNFLLNYPGCIASSGPQYGIPPTILSPHPFLGGSLVENSVKQSTIGDSHQTASSRLAESIQEWSKSTRSSTHRVIEICGPILPHHSLNISSIVRTFTSSSKLSFCIHPPTIAFNTVENSEETLNILTTGLGKLLVPYSPSDSGLLKDVEEVLCSEESMSVKEASILNHKVFVE